MRTEMGRRAGSKQAIGEFNKIVVDLPAALDASFVESLRTQLVEHTTSSWSFYFGLLEDYTGAKGHAKVPTAFVTAEGYKLGNWVGAQRTARQDGELSQLRIDRLESLGGWSWNAFVDKWEEGLAQLTGYIRANGSARVPRDYVTPEGYNLGSWVGMQRTAKQQDQIAQERVDRLASLPGWSWDPFLDQWEEGLEQLALYAKRSGSARVPVGYVTAEAFNLGSWVATQRQAARKRRLSQSQVARLESLPGWSWDPIGEQWEEGFKQLELYATGSGHALVPAAFVTVEAFKLGGWVSTQRFAKKKNRLSQFQIARLESLPGWSWDPLIEQWEQGFQELEKYAHANGDARVPAVSITPEGYNLGAWVSNQRMAKQRRRLSQCQVERLEALQGWSWDPLSDQWEKGFEQLKQYVSVNGNARATQDYITSENFKLGGWVNAQRFAKKKSRLSQSQVARLESLPGWSWDPFGDQWEEGFKQLERWVSSNGFARVAQNYVTPEGYRLGPWITTQRLARRRNRLIQSQVERLEALPGWSWDPRSEQWEERFQQLVQYVESNGTGVVPYSYVTSTGDNLGLWVTAQRRAKRRNELDQQRVDRLASIPGWSWDPHTDHWAEGFEQLEKYVEATGNARVPTNYVTPDGYILGVWSRNQRIARKKKRLNQAQEERLESLPGWSWSVRSK